MNRLALLLIAAFVCAGLAGCAPKEPTRSELLELKTITDQSRVRIYDEPPDLILRAAERALYESDHKYHPVPGVQTETTYRAVRKWFFTLVFATAMGSDYWEISAVKNEAGKTVVTATCWRGASQEGFIAPILSGPPQGSRDEYRLAPFLYALFFDRLDYMLGKKEEWKTCTQAQMEWRHTIRLMKDVDQTLFPFCNYADEGIPDHRL